MTICSNWEFCLCTSDYFCIIHTGSHRRQCEHILHNNGMHCAFSVDDDGAENLPWHVHSQCIFDLFLAIASSTAFSCSSSSSRRDDVMLWRLALAALLADDRAPEYELMSANGGMGAEVLYAIMPVVCRATGPSVLGAVLLDDSLDSTQINIKNARYSGNCMKTLYILYNTGSIWTKRGADITQQLTTSSITSSSNIPLFSFLTDIIINCPLLTR